MNEEAIDNQLFEARRQMIDECLDEDGRMTEAEAMALMRLAYAKGYFDARRQPDQETAKRLALALEVINPLTGEMC